MRSDCCHQRPPHDVGLIFTLHHVLYPGDILHKAPLYTVLMRERAAEWSWHSVHSFYLVREHSKVKEYQ